MQCIYGCIPMNPERLMTFRWCLNELCSLLRLQQVIRNSVLERVIRPLSSRAFKDFLSSTASSTLSAPDRKLST